MPAGRSRRSEAPARSKNLFASTASGWSPTFPRGRRPGRRSGSAGRIGGARSRAFNDVARRLPAGAPERLAARYLQALAHTELGEWTQARDLFEDLHERYAGAGAVPRLPGGSMPAAARGHGRSAGLGGEGAGRLGPGGRDLLAEDAGAGREPAMGGGRARGGPVPRAVHLRAAAGGGDVPAGGGDGEPVPARGSRLPPSTGGSGPRRRSTAGRAGPRSGSRCWRRRPGGTPAGKTRPARARLTCGVSPPTSGSPAAWCFSSATRTSGPRRPSARR